MQRNGWIKLWRNTMEQPIWLEDPFTRGQAWVDLQMLASGIEDERHHKGWVYCSVRYLAKRWQWGFDRTKRFLLFLEGQGLILLYPGRAKSETELATEVNEKNGVGISADSNGPDKNDIKIGYNSQGGAVFSTEFRAENGALLSLVPQGVAVPRRTANGTEYQTKTHTNKEVYRSMRQTAGASGTIEKEIPAEYRDRFTSWAEYAEWRYQ